MFDDLTLRGVFWEQHGDSEDEGIDATITVEDGIAFIRAVEGNMEVRLTFMEVLEIAKEMYQSS